MSAVGRRIGGSGQPRVVERSEGLVELTWAAPTQLVGSIMFAVAALAGGAIPFFATPPAPWPALVVVFALVLGFLAGAFWMFVHREARLRIDSHGMALTDRLSGFSADWGSISSVALSDGRGGPRIVVQSDVPITAKGRRRVEIPVPASLVPEIATLIELWTGRPLTVSVAGRAEPHVPTDASPAVDGPTGGGSDA